MLNSNNNTFFYKKTESTNVKHVKQDNQVLQLLVDVKSEILNLKSWINLINKKIDFNEHETALLKKVEYGKAVNLSQLSNTLFTLSDAFDKLTAKFVELDKRLSVVESILKTRPNQNSTKDISSSNIHSNNLSKTSNFKNNSIISKDIIDFNLKKRQHKLKEKDIDNYLQKLEEDFHLNEN